jgi:plastocyanin
MPMFRVLAVTALLIAGACGGGTDYGGNPPPPPPPPGPPPPPPPPPGPTLSVSVNNTNTFSPSNGSVTSGGTVTWNWAAGSVTHNVTFEDGQMNSGDLSSGSHQRAFPTVTSSTTFRYRCTRHSASFTSGTMIGQIVVVP